MICCIDTGQIDHTIQGDDIYFEPIAFYDSFDENNSDGINYLQPLPETNSNGVYLQPVDCEATGNTSNGGYLLQIEENTINDFSFSHATSFQSEVDHEHNVHIVCDQAIDLTRTYVGCHEKVRKVRP